MAIDVPGLSVETLNAALSLRNLPNVSVFSDTRQNIIGNPTLSFPCTGTPVCVLVRATVSSGSVSAHTAGWGSSLSCSAEYEYASPSRAFGGTMIGVLGYLPFDGGFATITASQWENGKCTLTVSGNQTNFSLSVLIFSLG